MPKTEVFLAGGLGNQLFQLAIAIQHAKGDKVFAHVSKSNIKLDEDGRADVEKFDLPENVVFVHQEPKSQIQVKIWRALLRLSNSSITKPPKYIYKQLWKCAVIAFKKTYNYEGQIVSEWMYSRGYYDTSLESLFVGYFQSSKVLEGINLKFLDAPVIEKNSYYLELEKIASKRDVVAIHIRRGDYINESKFGLLQVEYFAKVMEQIEHQTKRCEFWLFSDDAATIENQLRLATKLNFRVISTSLLDTVMTFSIMRKASKYIISNSSFSWWASTRDAENPAEVYAPFPWFKEQQFHEHIYQNIWTTVIAEFNQINDPIHHNSTINQYN
jgi:hypothetical protein